MPITWDTDARSNIIISCEKSKIEKTKMKTVSRLRGNDLKRCANNILLVHVIDKGFSSEIGFT